jgi:hypothetical protein
MEHPSGESEKHMGTKKCKKMPSYNVSIFHSVHDHCPLNIYSIHSVYIFTPKNNNYYSQLVSKGWCKLKWCPTSREILLHPQLKTAQLPQNFTTINTTKFPYTVTEANTSVVILTGVLFTLLHNIFR